MKTRKLLFTAVAGLFLASFMGGCKDEKVGVVGQCPVVVSTNPANLATNVPLDQTISVTFNEAINPNSITPDAFTFVDAGGVGGRVGTQATVSGKLTYDAATFTMNYTPKAKLQAGMTYTATVATMVKDLTGNALQVSYKWTFGTGATLSPMVISTDPINAATGVPTNKTVVANFSNAMNPTSITASTFTLKQGATAIAGAVSYAGTAASFKPAAALTINTLYTATVTTGGKDVAGNKLLADYVWTFTTGAVAAPTVNTTDPAALATAVALNKVIRATFSEAMNPATITTSSFTVANGATPVAGTVTYSGTTASFTPTGNLVSSTIYTATITTAAKNPVGTALANNFVWTFTTGNVTAPRVNATSPVDLATSVPLNSVVTATFSEVMNPLTITTTTFTLAIGATSVLGAVTYSGNTATFTPTSNLASSTTYTATMTTGAKNPGGTPLTANHVWTFSTGITTAPRVTATNPLDLANGVALNQVVSANFSEAMDPLTITTLTFTMTTGGNPVAGAVNYSGTTATFTPTSNLLSGNTYTATVTTGAKNPTGTPIATNYVWTFSTVAPLGPLNVDLKSVARFGIIAGVGVSNNAGFSEIHNMDVGISPGVRSSITGFPPAIIVNGAIYASDDIAPPGVPAMLTAAKQDLVNAYLFAEGATSPAPAIVSGDLGGTTLAPGIYKTTSSLLIQSGDLTLDAQGDVNAVWIFQVASAFTTIGGAGGNVILSGGAQAKNIYWQTGSSATIGDFTIFKGNVLALQSITMNSGATATGRMLARNGSVVMTSTNIIDKP